MDDQVVDLVNGRPVTRGMLLAAFNKVADPENWKNPINAVIPLKDRNIVDRAIKYFAGSVAKFSWCGNNSWYVKANGYYMDIGS